MSFSFNSATKCANFFSFWLCAQIHTREREVGTKSYLERQIKLSMALEDAHRNSKTLLEKITMKYTKIQGDDQCELESFALFSAVTPARCGCSDDECCFHELKYAKYFSTLL